MARPASPRPHPGVPSRRPAAACLVVVALAAGCGPSSPRPGSAGGAAYQLAAGEDFRRVAPAATTSTAFALQPLRDEQVGRLTYLARGAQPVELSLNGDINALRVSMGAPAAALFVEPAGEGDAGQLRWVDLSSRTLTPVAIEGASRVRAEATWWGATGRQLLFVATSDDAPESGALHWSSGARTEKLAESVPVASVTVAPGRGRAAALAEVDAETGQGRLVLVELTSGKLTQTALSVRAVDPSGAPPLVAMEGGFAAVDADGQLVRQGSGGARAAVLAPAATALSASADGRVVAFHSEEGLSVWRAESVRRVDALASPLPARLSPTGDRIAWLRDVQWRDGIAWGRLMLAALPDSDAEGTSITPVALGDAARLDELQFGPDGGSVAALVERRAPDGSPNAGTPGTLVVAWPQEAGGWRIDRPGQRVRPGDVVALPEAGSWGFLEPPAIGARESSVVAALPGGGRWVLAGGARPGSLLGAPGFDSLAWRAPSGSCVGLAAVGTDCRFEVSALSGATPGGAVQSLQTAVTDAARARDGRLLVAVPSGDTAGVWSLPAP